ncbi:MAG: DUF1330 domain-containing protein [Acidobacteria bacterium]|nr:DUF1330 domain-containing protein [Acidobacteriota bacterium]
MSAYIVADVEVLDKEKYEAYRQRVPPSIARYGGRFLVRGGDLETLEGTWSPARLIILEFPSVAQAKAWWGSVEYSQPKALRQASASTRMVVVEGV